MTIEQRDAIQAVLKAVRDAVETGLTKRHIIAVIEAEREAARYSTPSPEPTNGTPQRYGWSALADGEKK
jgi:hypothetical protein